MLRQTDGQTQLQTGRQTGREEKERGEAGEGDRARRQEKVGAQSGRNGKVCAQVQGGWLERKNLTCVIRRETALRFLSQDSLLVGWLLNVPATG